jgi:hypothetical protein
LEIEELEESNVEMGGLEEGNIGMDEFNEVQMDKMESDVLNNNKRKPR